MRTEEEATRFAPRRHVGGRSANIWQLTLAPSLVLSHPSLAHCKLRKCLPYAADASFIFNLLQNWQW